MTLINNMELGIIKLRDSMHKLGAVSCYQAVHRWHGELMTSKIRAPAKHILTLLVTDIIR